jgi:hypothetical protein
VTKKMTTLVWGAMIGVISIVGFIALQRYVLPTFLPVTVDSLHAEPIELVKLAPNENRQFSVLLSNTSFRRFVLKASGNCACMALTKEAIVVSGKHSVEIPFAFRAGSTPGVVEKQITFVATDYPDLQWNVPVKAEVVAKIWAEPSLIQADLASREPSFTTSVAIRHQSDVRVGTITASPATIKVTAKRTSPELLKAELVIEPSSSSSGNRGDGFVQVFDANNSEELLRIPVSWSRRPELRCNPELLILDNASSGSDESLEKTVLLFAKSNREGSVKAESLVSWIRVEKIESKSFGFLMRVRIDRRTMPAKVDEAVLRFKADGIATPAYLRVRTDA